MLSTHNLPCLLVELLEHSPWSRREGGKASPTCQDLTGCFQKILGVNGSRHYGMYNVWNYNGMDSPHTEDTRTPHPKWG